MPQQCVFYQQFGFTSGQIGESLKHEESRRWFDPSRNTFLERVKAETDVLLDRKHSYNQITVLGAQDIYGYQGYAPGDDPQGKKQLCLLDGTTGKDR